jgi:hypothetical protein
MKRRALSWVERYESERAFVIPLQAK